MKKSPKIFLSEREIAIENEFYKRRLEQIDSLRRYILSSRPDFERAVNNLFRLLFARYPEDEIELGCLRYDVLRTFDMKPCTCLDDLASCVNSYFSQKHRNGLIVPDENLPLYYVQTEIDFDNLVF